MITTYRQLLTETLAKYENAPCLNRTGLSTTGTTCFYRPIFNPVAQALGIGCGLGCHIEREKAILLDKAIGPTGIQFVYKADPEYKKIIDETFDVLQIGMANLMHVQQMHDKGSDSVEEFRKLLADELARLPELRTLNSRVQQFSPFGQVLYFDDGTAEFDPECSQTTPILTAELYNGRAAKNSAGAWVHAPGMRLHEYTDGLLGFAVGLTFLTLDVQGKAVYDYSVITPTGVEFHGDEATDNLIVVPLRWSIGRVMGECVAWICLGEDSMATYPADTTPEQWEWIRSAERETKEAEIDEWIERFDRANR